jgi:hypothetical protein
MRRIQLSILTIVILIALLVPAAFAMAASPHFMSASASGPNSVGNLTVSFKESGLGDNALIDYTAVAYGTAVYACLNGGGNHPKASNKETVSGPVSASGEFNSGKNGTISASLVIAPPGQGAFSCPSGQRLVLASVSYSNVLISDTSNGISQPIDGTYERVFFEV